jgi:hypothetical protein
MPETERGSATRSGFAGRMRTDDWWRMEILMRCGSQSRAPGACHSGAVEVQAANQAKIGNGKFRSTPNKIQAAR